MQAVTRAPDTLLEELSEVDARLERAAPSEAIAWAFERFSGDVALACSFEDVVLLDLVLAQRPDAEVLFLDTGGHFQETLDFAARVATERHVNLHTLRPGPEADAWPCGTARCCELRKVAPLAAALVGHDAWITALKRVDAPTREAAPVVGWDDRFALAKVNPLATWTDDDVAYYLRSHDLPEHPLWAKGYASIGCAAMTAPPRPGEGRRSGRWVGLDKEECGLHEA